jgi:hypothetical protein
MPLNELKYKRLKKRLPSLSKPNQINQKGSLSKMAAIRLTQDKIAIIDDDDFERVSKHKWYYRGRYGSRVNEQGYVLRTVRETGKKQTTISLQRFVMNNPEGFQVDHVNGDRLDNRKCNLRVATMEQNSHNSTLRKNNTSGFKGVYFKKANQRFFAKISINKKPTHLGYFSTAIDAAKTYDEAARKHYGEFATLNFPNDGERAATI